MGDSDETGETSGGEEEELLDGLDGDEADLELLDIEEVPLSGELESGLEAFVLIEDWELATSRAETLDVMVDGLRELEDDAAIEEWVAQYGDRDFHLAQERDGRLVVSDVFPVSGVVGFIPRSIVRMLSTELLLQDEDDREGWLESLSALSSEWLALLSDEEKMVGHLIRAHELPVNETTGDLGDLVGQHATLHAVGADDEDDDEG
ncbi:MAG: hypothetical protein QOD62_2979 [Actinomycetota bacterium]|nr:hypothetical protein [Actinomycetota bacterium]